MNQDDPSLWQAATPDPDAVHAALSDEERRFLDGIVVFMRAIPLYPTGHVRVDDAVARLQAAMAAGPESIRIEVHDQELVLQGKTVPVHGGRKALRDALLATGVARVTFDRDAPKTSLVHFARMLHRNQKLVKDAGVMFEHLWSDPAPGVTVEERVYGLGAFVDEAELFEVADEPDSPEGTPAPPAEGKRVGSRPMRTVSRELRRRARESDRTRTLLDGLKGRFQPPRDEHRAVDRLDLLEYVLRLLPAEARRDPDAGLRIVERILERFTAAINVQTGSPGPENLVATLVRTVTGLFPSTSHPVFRSQAPAEDDSLPKTAEDLRREKERDLDEDLDLVRGVAHSDAAAHPPIFSADVGVGETGAILIHSLVTSADPGRRDLLKTRLVHILREKADPADVQCLKEHLHEAVDGFLANPAQTDRLRILTAVVAEARLYEMAKACGALAPPVVAATFPNLLTAFRHVGGRMGLICRLVGRAPVLATAPALLAPGGPLFGDGAAKMLAEKTADCLPMIEVLVRSGDPALRERALRALRVMDLPSIAAAALRALPAPRLADVFLCGLCEDGFAGEDSHRFDVEAAALLSDVVLSNTQDLAVRLYAIAALGSFPPEISEPVLRSVWRARRLAFPLLREHPKEARRAARAVLDRFDLERRAAAIGAPRPDPNPWETIRRSA